MLDGLLAAASGIHLERSMYQKLLSPEAAALQLIHFFQAGVSVIVSMLFLQFDQDMSITAGLLVFLAFVQAQLFRTPCVQH